MWSGYGDGVLTPGKEALAFCDPESLISVNPSWGLKDRLLRGFSDAGSVRPGPLGSAPWLCLGKKCPAIWFLQMRRRCPRVSLLGAYGSRHQKSTGDVESAGQRRAESPSPHHPPLGSERPPPTQGPPWGWQALPTSLCWQDGELTVSHLTCWPPW